MFREPAAPPETPWAFSLVVGAFLAIYVGDTHGTIAAPWVAAALAVIAALLIGSGLLGLWNSFPAPRSMGTVIRILLGALALVVVFAAVHMAVSVLGIERRWSISHGRWWHRRRSRRSRDAPTRHSHHRRIAASRGARRAVNLQQVIRGGPPSP